MPDARDLLDLLADARRALARGGLTRPTLMQAADDVEWLGRAIGAALDRDDIGRRPSPQCGPDTETVARLRREGLA